MTLGPVSDLLSADLLARPAGQSDPDQGLPRAASEFESLLVAQMLRSFREASSGGWLDESEKDGPGATMMEMAEQQFARAITSQGGLGLRELIVSGLSRPGAGASADDEGASAPESAVSPEPAAGSRYAGR